MTTDSPLPNSGYTAQNPFHYLTQLEVRLWTVPLSLMTEPHAQFLCCSLLTTTGFWWAFRTPASNTAFSFNIYFFRRGSQPVQSFRKYIKNKSISNCPGPTSIQQLPDIHFVWYMTGQYFNRLDDPNTPLLKRLLLFLYNTQWTETDRKAMEDLRFFSKPVSVFVNYLKWVYYKKNRTSCNFKK